MGKRNKRAAPLQRWLLAAVASLGITLFFGGQARCGPQYGLYRGDIQRTGRSTYVATYNPQAEWSYNTGSISSTTPVIGEDGTVYYGTMNKYLYAVGSDGVMRWRNYSNSIVAGSAAIDNDGSIYYGTLTGKLYALNSDGSSKWSDPYAFNTQGTYDAMLLGNTGAICFGADDGKVYAVSEDRSLMWSTALGTTGEPVKHGLAASPDGTTLYAACSDGYVYALNSQNGSICWKSNKIDPVNLCAVGNDGSIYIGSSNGSMYALNADGSVKWRFQAGSAVTSAAAVGFDGSVYFGSADRNLYALNPDGTLKWKYKTYAAVHCSPTIDLLGTVLLGTYNGLLLGLDSADGAVKWSRSVGGIIYNSPVVANDGSIYVLNNSGILTKYIGPTYDVVVPEPASLLALVAGVGTLGLMYRSRKRK